MNGPQHYQEAERLYKLANDMSDSGAQIQQVALAAALVDAVLALTAATLTARGYGESDWTEVTR